MNKTHVDVMPEAKPVRSERNWIAAKVLLPVFGLFSLCWFVVRVIPKPSRAGYPCMQVAMPAASGFVLWLVGIWGSVVAIHKTRGWLRGSRYLRAGTCMGLVVIAVCLFSFASTRLPASLTLGAALEPENPSDPANDPIGVPKGVNPGRVVWVHDPEATDWAGPDSGEPCWTQEHTNQVVVDSMMSRAIRWLAGTDSDSEAWDAVLRYFNRQRGHGDRGYLPGEKVAIKINLVSCNATTILNPETRVRTTLLDSAADTSPQMVLALLRQLVNVVGVKQSDIAVGDPGSYFPQQWYDLIAPEFPNIIYLDHHGFTGRTRVEYSTTPFYWSTSEADGKVQDYLPVAFAEADYIINFAALKSHSAGITVCAKNHYGSLIRNPTGYAWSEVNDYYGLHDSLPSSSTPQVRGSYRALVDLMGHRDLGGKTFLYLIDGLYGGYYWDGTPFKWNMPPFNGDWPSSLFASQDPVAIDSVAYDFLEHEWPGVVSGGRGDPGSLQGSAQDYLHEAAMANDPPSGTVYDPERDAAAMGSLGVHEHWNNSVDKHYSRNFNSGSGIELISFDPTPSLIPGDIDGNHHVQLKDAVLAVRVLCQIEPNPKVNLQADVNANGKIGLPEIIFVLQKASGLR